MSRRRHSIPLEQPPAEIICGAQITAEYLGQEVPDFRNNPLIEGLPPTLTPREVTEYLLQLPPYSDKDREMSQVARLQMTETAREFFVPNGKHLTVYYAITNMVRRGYVRRNPVLWEYWKRAHNNITSFLKAIKEMPFPSSRARGLAIIGTGGTGKSTTVEKILQSLPQVITHVSYKNQVFIMKQLVWLKLDCPRKGSLRELCVNFFRAADEILGTMYEKNYAGSSRRSLESLIAGIARVAANHCLGLVVIDEIQDLSEARSGGDITMVNFFVHLENAIGVPFALIGTQDAIPLLSTQFRQARRVSEQGYIVWDRMSEIEPEIEGFEEEDDDEETVAGLHSLTKPHGNLEKEDVQKIVPLPDPIWKNFIETMWTYQYVKQPRTLKENVIEDKCAHALYRAAKGIPAVVQTIFVLTQQLAILNGEEKITPRLIRETVRDNQQVIMELLGEAIIKTPRRITPVGDLSDLDIIYEAVEIYNGLPIEADGSKTMNQNTKVDAGADISADNQEWQEEATCKSKVNALSITSDTKAKRSNTKPQPRRNNIPKDTPLRGADFREANLLKADLLGADVLGAKFQDSQFHKTVWINGRTIQSGTLDDLISETDLGTKLTLLHKWLRRRQRCYS